MGHVSPNLRCHPGRSDFPSPVGGHGLVHRAFLHRRRLEHWLACAPHPCSWPEDWLLTTSYRPSRAQRLKGRSRPEPPCPRAALPRAGVTVARVASGVTWEGVTPPSSLIPTHAPNHSPPTGFGITWSDGSSQVAASPCWKVVLPDVISAVLSLRAWTRTSEGLLGARTRFFPSRQRPSPVKQKIGFPSLPRTATSVRIRFSRLQSFANVQARKFARHPGRSHCRSVPTAASDFYIRAEHGSLPSRASDMLADRIGQGRHEDFSLWIHLTRTAALSAAPT